MTSILKVDTIQGANGSDIPYIKGHVLQVKYFQLTISQIETIAAANTDQIISNFNIDITPKSTSSIIKLEASIMHECANGSQDTMWFFYRDTTKLGNTQASPGNRKIGISPSLPSHGNTTPDNDSTPEFASLTYFDAPQTTSAINYKLGVNSNGTNMLFINRTVGDTDSVAFDRGVSFISVTEIGG